MLGSCLEQSGEVLVTWRPGSSCSSSSCSSASNINCPFSVGGRPLTSSKLTNEVDLQLLELCIRNNNEKAFLFLFSSSTCQLDQKGLERLVTTACRSKNSPLYIFTPPNPAPLSPSQLILGCRYGLVGCLDALLQRDPEATRVFHFSPIFPLDNIQKFGSSLASQKKNIAQHL